MTSPPITTHPIAWYDRLFWFALVVYTFTLPISHTIAVRYAAFALLIVATVSLCLGNRQLPALPLKGAWAAYACVALISCVNAVVPMQSLGEVRVEILYCLLVFLMGVTWAKQRDLLEPFACVAAAANLILVAIGLGVAGFGKSIPELLQLPGWVRAGLNANYLLTMAALVFYLGWTQWIKGKHALSVGIFLLLIADVLSMFVSLNRQALVALATGLLCAAILLLQRSFTWKRVGAAVGVVLIVTGLIFVQVLHRAETIENIDSIAQTTVSRDVRWKLWKFSMEKIVEHPLTGGGFGRAVFEKLYPDFMPDDPMIWHAHNMVLNKGIQMGIPGIAAFLLLWFALLRAFAAHLGSPANRGAIAIVGITTLATVFMKNMTDDFFVRDMALWFWMVNGILLGSLQRLAVREDHSVKAQ